MPDAEKVIKGLEWCMNEKHDCYKEKGCPYENEGEDIGCKYALHRDALALLKAQEPRVIELYEFENVLGRDVPLYFEQRDDISGWDIYSGLEKGTMDIITSAKWAEDQTWQREYYWKDWRCWTSRPTDEQREAIPWN